MAGIGWNRLKMTDWMAMAGAVSALVLSLAPGLGLVPPATSRGKNHSGIYQHDISFFCVEKIRDKKKLFCLTVKRKNNHTFLV